MQECRKLYNTNVFGLLAVTQSFLPLVRRAQGRIVNVSSLTTLLATPFHGIYSSAKMAVNGITDALRLEMKPFGVQVSLMIYGGVKTPLWERVAKSTADVVDRLPPEFHKLYASGQQRALAFFTTQAGRKGISPEDAAKPVVHCTFSKASQRHVYRRLRCEVLQRAQQCIMRLAARLVDPEKYGLESMMTALKRTGMEERPGASWIRKKLMVSLFPDFPHGIILIICTLLYTINYMDRQVLSITIESIKRDLHLSDTQIGLIQTLFFSSMAVFSFPAAYLVDRWSRKKAVCVMPFSGASSRS